jgi:hypothetical protein
LLAPRSESVTWCLRREAGMAKNKKRTKRIVDDLIAWPIIEVDGVPHLVDHRVEWDADSKWDEMSHGD